MPERCRCTVGIPVDGLVKGYIVHGLSASVTIRDSIRGAFSMEEWEKLLRNSEFKDALKRAKTQSEARSLISLGYWLLNKPNPSNGQQSPPARHVIENRSHI
jgi:hypothetical protein